MPYLAKGAGGESFELGSFIALVAFVGVIGFWLWTASPMLGTFGRWLGIGKAIVPVTYSNTPTPLPENPFPVSLSAPAEITVDVSITQAQSEIYPTYTPYPTQTPYPTYTPYPVQATATPTPIYNLSLGIPDPGITAWQDVTVRVSYYWPPLCEGITREDANSINCDWVLQPDGSYKPDIEHVSTGHSWLGYEGKWIACPVEWPIGSLVKVDGYVFRCSDRGGAIVRNADGSYWIDLLYPRFPDGWYWGKLFDAQVWIIDS